MVKGNCGYAESEKERRAMLVFYGVTYESCHLTPREWSR